MEVGDEERQWRFDLLYFFFSRRRRESEFLPVTGGQACALPDFLPECIFF